MYTIYTIYYTLSILTICVTIILGYYYMHIFESSTYTLSTIIDKTHSLSFPCRVFSITYLYILFFSPKVINYLTSLDQLKYIYSILQHTPSYHSYITIICYIIPSIDKVLYGGGWTTAIHSTDRGF